MKEAIGIGFLGAGPVTQAIHLPALALLGDDLFRTVRVMDINSDVANEVADRCGAIGTTDESPLYDDPNVEVVAICSPNAFHAEQVIASCRAGKKAVLCEKPLAVSKDEAAAIREAAERSGTAVFVGTMHAYDPAYLAARDAWRQTGDVAIQVRSGIYLPSNDVYTDQATQIVQVPAPQRHPRSHDVDLRKETMRGAMLGLAIHDIPLVRDFYPDPGSLTHAVFHPPFGYSLVAHSAVSTVELTALMPGSWPPKWTFEVVGRRHRLYAEMPPSYVMAGSARIELSGATGRHVFQFATNGYQRLWQAVRDTVRHGALPPISLESAVDDLAFALDLAQGIDQLLEERA